MKSYTKIFASIVAAVGALLFIFNLYFNRVNPGISYLLNIVVTAMIHNSTIAAIVQECRERRFAWKESDQVRKNALFLFMMFAIYSLITFVAVRIKFG
nr:hypothetical protein [uncultured Caproiciproducens sp.]